MSLYLLGINGLKKKKPADRESNSHSILFQGSLHLSLLLGTATDSLCPPFQKGDLFVLFICFNWPAPRVLRLFCTIASRARVAISADERQGLEFQAVAWLEEEIFCNFFFARAFTKDRWSLPIGFFVESNAGSALKRQIEPVSPTGTPRAPPPVPASPPKVVLFCRFVCLYFEDARGSPKFRELEIRMLPPPRRRTRPIVFSGSLLSCWTAARPSQMPRRPPSLDNAFYIETCPIFAGPSSFVALARCPGVVEVSRNADDDLRLTFSPKRSPRGPSLSFIFWKDECWNLLRVWTLSSKPPFINFKHANILTALMLLQVIRIRVFDFICKASHYLCPHETSWLHINQCSLALPTWPSVSLCSEDRDPTRFFAGRPTTRSPFAVKPTIDGVVRPPSEFWMTTGSPFSMTATHEFVVPRSIPIIFPIVFLSSSIL